MLWASLVSSTARWMESNICTDWLCPQPHGWTSRLCTFRHSEAALAWMDFSCLQSRELIKCDAGKVASCFVMIGIVVPSWIVGSILDMSLAWLRACTLLIGWKLLGVGFAAPRPELSVCACMISSSTMRFLPCPSKPAMPEPSAGPVAWCRTAYISFLTCGSCSTHGSSSLLLSTLPRLPCSLSCLGLRV